MKIAGIVAEYNPFHVGHARHLRLTKEVLGADTLLVCVLSGDFVQRGEAAIMSKYARAESACRSGVDLVLELPLPWCLASAESFARGAVSLLDHVGCTHLSFGSELGALDALQEIAEKLLLPDFQARVSAQMKAQPELSYAEARERVLYACIGTRAHLIQTPNNILAVEYIKALRMLGSAMQSLTIRREGSVHDGEEGELCSAYELRRRLYEGKSCSGLMPPESEVVLQREISAGRALPERETMETAILSRLLTMKKESFDALPDAADGLGRRLYEALRTQAGLAAVMEQTKTKRYALSRVRRLLYGAALGVEAGMSAGIPPYARVLAFRDSARALLRNKRDDNGSLLLIKPAAVTELGEEAQRIFSLGAAAHDLYALSYPDRTQRRAGEDWRTGPFIL